MKKESQPHHQQKEIFDNSKTIYKDTLKMSGLKNKLSYSQNIIQNNDEHQEKKERKRNVIWYTIHLIQ